MTQQKPLTKTGLVKTLKKVGVATKDDIFKTASKASDAILNGMGEMFSEHDKRFDNLEVELREVKSQINDLKWDSPSRGEFNKLKTKVYRHHPAN